MSKLESEGIKCFLDGEKLMTANLLYSNALGGVKLNIFESDLEKAVEIFQEIEQLAEKNVTYSVDKSFVEGYEKIETYCPKCESINVFRKKVIWDSFVFFFLFFPIFLYFKIIKRKHYCADCGNTWNL